MNIATTYKRFFILPVLLAVLSAAALLSWGLQPGIDLAGGSLLEVSYPDTRPAVREIGAVLTEAGFPASRVQAAGENGYLIRTPTLSEKDRVGLVSELSKLGTLEERQFTSISPAIGGETLRKGLLAIVLVVILIILFIAFAFRKVSEPVASWKYGVVTILTLAHDLLIPAGLFAVLGRFLGAEVDSLFIVALLAILGISINDTIVVFDRIRENLGINIEKHRAEPFSIVVERSVRQTIARSINTSLSVIIMLLTLYFVGPDSTKVFALTLLAGLIAGTYSSIFLASPLLIVWEKWSKRG